MAKPSRSFPRPLSELLGATIAERFAQQGFASRELVTRWADIVGADIAAHCEPLRIQWPRNADTDDPEPATLVLRVEGPAALEIQHQSAVILERVNRFFGWQAIGCLALRQAPLRKRNKPKRPEALNEEEVSQIAEKLPEIADGSLRTAVARLGASVKRK